MHMLRFLGEVSVGLPPGAARRELLRPRSVALLACLSASDRGGLTRDRIVALVWDGSDREHARHSLSNQLHLLRRNLGPDSIVTPGKFVSLNPEIVTADVTQFKHAVRIGDLERAADLYLGPFLDGFHLDGSTEFERWLDEERQLLAVQALEVFESLAARAQSDGSPDAGLKWLQRAARHDPYNSRAAIAVARALAARRDPGNAVQLLLDHVQKLEDDLGIAPDPEILELIETGEFSARPRPSPAVVTAGAAARALAPQTPEFAGRTGPVRGRHRKVRLAASLIATVLLVVATGSVVQRLRGGESYDMDQVAILPVRAIGIDSLVALLVTEELYAELADWETLDAKRRAETEDLWRRIGRPDTEAGGAGAPLDVGFRVGAGAVLISSVSRAAHGVLVSASLVGVPNGETVATARASGPLDSLSAVVHGLIVHLVADAKGIPSDRVATLTSHDPRAVRLFIGAHPHESVESDRLLKEAIARDSTFALAALELYEGFTDPSMPDADDPAAVEEAAAWDEVASVIWENRDRLSPADRAYAEARLAWRYNELHTAGKEVAAWERAVNIAPDRLSHWQRLFEACYTWCSSYRRNWRAPLLEIHDTLLERGDSSTVELGMELALMAGDTERLRAYMEILPGDAWYGRWLAGVGLGLERERAAVVARMPDLGSFPLMRIGNFAILTGLGLDDAEQQARQVQRGDPGSIYSLRQAVLARERGRHAEYRRHRDKLFQYFEVRQGVDAIAAANVIAEWAIFGEPESDAALDRADRMLSRIISVGSGGSPDSLAVAHCYRAYLRVERGDSTDVAESILFLEADPSVRRLALSRMCAPFLAYLVTRRESREAHSEAAGRLHEAVRARPLTLGRGPGLHYTDLYIASAANLELARSFGELGHPETGLQVVERRPVRPGHWGLFGFHIEFVREEARLLAQAGQTEAALDRYAKYFRLRPEPPDLDSWAKEWTIVRAEFEALQESS